MLNGGVRQMVMAVLGMCISEVFLCLPWLL
jgi:hypothetical protein